MNQSDTEFSENIPSVNSGFPQVEMDDGTIINEELGSVINIGQIELDYSWALIHSVCNVFLKCDIESYLDIL